MRRRFDAVLEMAAVGLNDDLTGGQNREPGALLTGIVYYFWTQSWELVVKGLWICIGLLQCKAVIVITYLTTVLVIEIVATRKHDSTIPTRHITLQFPRPKFTSWNGRLACFCKIATAGIEPAASRHCQSDARVTDWATSPDESTAWRVVIYRQQSIPALLFIFLHLFLHFLLPSSFALFTSSFGGHPCRQDISVSS